MEGRDSSSPPPPQPPLQQVRGIAGRCRMRGAAGHCLPGPTKNAMARRESAPTPVRHPAHLSRPADSMRDTEASIKPPSCAPPARLPLCEWFAPAAEPSQEAAEAALGARECPRDSWLAAPLPRSPGGSSR